MVAEAVRGELCRVSRSKSMRERERIVRERFADQKCAHCGSSYPGEGVVILARRSSAWMVMASCAHCLRPGVFLVSFPSQASSQETSIAPSQSSVNHPEASIDVSPISTMPLIPSSEPTGDAAFMPQHESFAPINAADVNSMHEFLATFNGNFARLFRKPE
jgi:hypothetical protein